MPSPVYVALFLTFAAWVLFLFTSVSPPVWSAISFLKAHSSTGTTVYGVFGSCVRDGVGGCTTRSVCYDLSAAGISNSTVNLNTSLMHNLTCTLVLHPVAGVLAFIAFLFGLLAVMVASRACTIFMGIFSLFAVVVALVAFVIDMVMWNVLKNRLHENNYDASLGNANWFTLAATVALLVASCTSICGACGRFATGRAAGEKY